ncbi:hypothetical protein C7974DRAFT_405413 [Boeremia exigua]|uniref:uncharacterized protein n=1 Tax=Boeremia exigua TaxID=749465 RepID=UPI001E8CDF9C|nr:uncharacterized protein C7974DRAFT_405413 [Boeremia exigua]KAH6612353.1 hypothetical protein C7974DRAFT_405413 [Boeremia exigua]
MEPRHNIIKLVVPGSAGETETLHVHQGVLCKSPEFFQRTMKPEWTNLKDKPYIIELPDDTVDTVSDSVKWLYAGSMSLTLYKADDEHRREKVAKEADKVFVLLAEAYVFGEKILDAGYKNAVMKTLEAAKESSRRNMGPESVGICYKGTPPGSPLRCQIAESVAHLAHDDTENGIGRMSFIDGYPKEALADALKATLRLRCKLEEDTQNGTKSNYLENYLYNSHPLR